MRKFLLFAAGFASLMTGCELKEPVKATSVPKNTAPFNVKAVDENLRPLTASVFLNAERVGQTPYTTDVPLGQHHLAVSDSGFFNYRTTLTIEDTFEVNVVAEMLKLPPIAVEVARVVLKAVVPDTMNFLVTRGDGDTTVFVSGATRLDTLVQPDVYTFSATAAGYQSWQQTVALGDGDAFVQDVVLEKVVEVPPRDTLFAEMTLSDSLIELGGSVVIAWESNADRVRISPVGHETTSSVGSFVWTPPDTGRWEIVGNFWKGMQMKTKSALLRVLKKQPPSPTTFGKLKITSEPSGALVVIPGRGPQVTPAEWDSLPPGDYPGIVVSLAGYVTAHVAAEIIPGQLTHIHLTLVKVEEPDPSRPLTLFAGDVYVHFGLKVRRIGRYDELAGADSVVATVLLGDSTQKYEQWEMEFRNTRSGISVWSGVFRDAGTGEFTRRVAKRLENDPYEVFLHSRARRPVNSVHLLYLVRYRKQ